MYHPQAAARPPVRQVTEDEAEMERILGKELVKHCSHCFVGCSNDLRPVLHLVFQRGGTQGCDCTVFWLAGIS